MGALNQYYVFETEQEAIAAEMEICNLGNFPIVNIDNNGVPQLDKIKTERWANPEQRLDGKWVFKRVPIEIAHTYPQDLLDDFANRHNYTIETFSEAWFQNE